MRGEWCGIGGQGTLSFDYSQGVGSHDHIGVQMERDVDFLKTGFFSIYPDLQTTPLDLSSSFRWCRSIDPTRKTKILRLTAQKYKI